MRFSHLGLASTPIAVRIALSSVASAALIVPLGWIFEPATPAGARLWTREPTYYLYKWTWYEWLGALAPLVFFGLLWQLCAQDAERRLLARFALAVFAYGVFQQVAGHGLALAAAPGAA